MTRAPIAIAALLAASIGGCSSCGKGDAPSAAIEPTPDAADGMRGIAPAQREVLTLATQLLGAQPLAPRFDDGGVKNDLMLFGVPGNKARALVLAHHEALAAKGAYLFLYRPNADAATAMLGLVPTMNPIDVVHIVGTTGVNPPHDTDAIVKWLGELAAIQPFVLSGVGQHFVEGAFDGPVKDPAAIAAKVDPFCPGFAQELADAKKTDAGVATKAWFQASPSFYFSWE